MKSYAAILSSVNQVSATSRSSTTWSDSSKGVLKSLLLINVHPRLNHAVIHQYVADAFLLKIPDQVPHLAEYGTVKRSACNFFKDGVQPCVAVRIVLPVVRVDSMPGIVFQPDEFILAIVENIPDGAFNDTTSSDRPSARRRMICARIFAQAFPTS